MLKKQDVIGSMWSYHLSKILPKGWKTGIRLKNGLTFMVRSRTADRMIMKEIFLQEIYNKYNIEVTAADTVIDIGANIGAFSLYASQKASRGIVYCFEPFPDNYQLLKEQLRINHIQNVQAFNLGVSNKAGQQDLYLSGINTGGHSLQFEQAAGKVTIQTTTLEQFCQDHQIHHIDFLKLDCEGSEFDIIKHNPDILHRISKIVMECHPYPSESVEGMKQLLESYGFTVIREACNHENIEMLYAKK